MIFKRLNFVEFIKAMTTASTAEHAEEARTKIFPKMEALDSFVTSFTPIKAAVGAENRVQQEWQADEDDVEADGAQVGVHNATAKAFSDFRETLSQPGRLLADIISNAQDFTFDEEFLAIANAEAMSSAFAFPWADLFKGTVPNEKVSGLSLPSLHGACIKWVQSTLAQPAAANSDASAIGDVDRSVTIATQHDVEEEEQMRKKRSPSWRSLLVKTFRSRRLGTKVTLRLR